MAEAKVTGAHSSSRLCFFRNSGGMNGWSPLELELELCEKQTRISTAAAASDI